jgi:hypothetical protein
MSTVRKFLVIVVAALILLIALFVAAVLLSPYVFDKLIVDAKFQDCTTLEAMGTFNSKDDIIEAVNSCAKTEGIYIRAVRFESFTPKKVTIMAVAVIEYSVPVAGIIRLPRRIEKKFFVRK